MIELKDIIINEMSQVDYDEFKSWVEYNETNHCRMGCPTQDHKSYADCCKGLQLNTGMMLSAAQKRQDSELDAYKRAREQGIQPDGTTMAKVEKANRISDATGVAYGG